MVKYPVEDADAWSVGSISGRVYVVELNQWGRGLVWISERSRRAIELATLPQ